MPMIDLDALQAFIECAEGVYLPVSDTIKIFRRLEVAGWHITRKPERPGIVAISDWTLSKEDSRRFIDALINPPEPSEALERAAAAFRREMSVHEEAEPTQPVDPGSPSCVG